MKTDARQKTGETVPLTFRLRPEERVQLSDLAKHRGLSQVDLIRVLVHEERDRLGMIRPAAEIFIESLIARYGPVAAITIEIDGGAEATMTIDGQEPDGVKVDLVHESATRASLRLEPEGTVWSLQLAEIFTGESEATLRYSLPLSSLSPDMYRRD